jgi:hypothetical protein
LCEEERIGRTEKFEENRLYIWPVGEKKFQRHNTFQMTRFPILSKARKPEGTMREFDKFHREKNSM